MVASRKSRRTSRKVKRRASRRHGRRQRAGGEEVKIYFMMTATTMKPVFSTVQSFNAILPSFSQNPVGTIGVNFPTTLTNAGTNFDITMTPGTDWATTKPGSLAGGTNKIVFQDTKGAGLIGLGTSLMKVTTPASAINPKATIAYPPTGIPLAGLKVGGLWTQGFGTQPGAGAVPPGAPAGTSAANICIKFNTVP